MATLTASNSILTLTIPLLYPFPVQLQGYATDDAFDVEPVEIAQTMMGVDGNMSYGYVPYSTDMAISLQADSPSMTVVEAWAEAQKTASDIFPAEGIIILPGVQRKYIMSTGVLKRYSTFSSVKKVLQARQFSITWENISPAPYSL